jgi:hypothetical protein
MTKEWQKRISERKQMVDDCVKDNSDLTDIELLNWSMNQLFRAARTIDDLLDLENDHHAAMGCDAAATVIFERLVKTPEGYNLIETTNYKLLEGYKKP